MGASFLFFFILTTCGVGFWAARQSRGSETDYFLASQSVSPFMLALSSSASKFSGFIFAGFMGMAFTKGLSVVWFSLGLAGGYFCIYYFIAKNVQRLNHGGWALSIAELLTFWQGENRVYLRRFIGLLTLFFLSIYAAAQFKAGGKALHVALDYPLYVGVLISVGVIIFYCWSGGIRASIVTDVVQALLMALSLLLIVVVTIVKSGGVSGTVQAFTQAAPNADFASLWPQNLSVGGLSGLGLFFLGSLSFGFCSMGQPHMLVRAMALKSEKDVKTFIKVNYAFEFIFVILFVLVGLCTRVLLGEQSIDPELSLFLSAQKTLPPIAVGFVLAGVLSATLSTADSQILSCSASLMRDLPEPPSNSLWGAKIGTLSVTLVAMLMALFADGSVFDLVAFAFGGLGVSIGSLLVLRILGAEVSEWGCIAISAVAFTALVVGTQMGLKAYVDPSVVGFVAAFGTYFIFKPWLKRLGGSAGF